MPIFIKNPEAYSTGFVSSGVGNFQVRLKPGTYSVLLVGGGGGGAGNNGSSTWHPTTSSGGGSGYATKARLVVPEGEIYTVVVGQGGAKSADGFPSLIRNSAGVQILSALGGKPGRYIGADGRTQGGDGGSGGGSGGIALIYNGNDYRWSVPGNGGYNGTDGGGNAAVSGAAKAGPGGKGQGAGYYDTVLSSMDAHILHGFTLGQHGRAGIRRHGNGTGGMRGSCGGGGGGMGTNVAPLHDFAAGGYGAGGTVHTSNALARGQDGYVSILNLDGSEPEISTNRWAKVNQPYYKLGANNWVPAKKVSYKIEERARDYVGTMSVAHGTGIIGGSIVAADGFAITGGGALHTSFGSLTTQTESLAVSKPTGIFWTNNGNGRATLAAYVNLPAAINSIILSLNTSSYLLTRHLSAGFNTGVFVAELDAFNFPGYSNPVAVRITDSSAGGGTVVETLPDGTRISHRWAEVWPNQITYIHTGYAESLNMYERFGRPSGPAHYVFINNGQIGSRDNDFALKTGTFPSGSVLTFVNNGTVSGRGGNGAYAPGTTNSTGGTLYPTTGTPGLLLEFPTGIVLNGGSVLQGGGGGGGGGREKSGSTYSRYGSGGAGLPAGLPSGGVAGRACYPNTAGNIIPLPGTLDTGGRHTGAGATSSFGGDPGQPGTITGWGNGVNTSFLHLGVGNPAIVNSGHITSITGNNDNTLKGPLKGGVGNAWMFVTATGTSSQGRNEGYFGTTHRLDFTGEGTLVSASQITGFGGVSFSISGRRLTVTVSGQARSNGVRTIRFNVVIRSVDGVNTTTEYRVCG